MRSFLRFALSFFALCLVLVGITYFFGPSSFREALRSDESAVGQVKPTDTLMDNSDSTGSPDSQPQRAGR